MHPFTYVPIGISFPLPNSPLKNKSFFQFFVVENVINISLKAREARKLNIETSINASINLTKWSFNWPNHKQELPISAYGGNISCMISTKYENTVQDIPNITPTK